MEYELRLNYDYDGDLGYTNNTIDISPNEVEIINGKTIINIYESDIKDLLRGTGI